MYSNAENWCKEGSRYENKDAGTRTYKYLVKSGCQKCLKGITKFMNIEKYSSLALLKGQKCLYFFFDQHNKQQILQQIAVTT